jgi:GAF domain-containing protein
VLITTHHPEALTDPARMRVLASIDFDDPTLRSEVDRITARTAARTAMPISMATLVLNTTQLVIGSAGLDNWISTADGTPVEWAFCAKTVTTGQPYVIPDAARSEQAANPLVTIDGIASYAGVPIVVHGHIVGAHCIKGAEPHPFTADQLAEVHAAAQEIAALLHRYSDLD